MILLTLVIIMYLVGSAGAFLLFYVAMRLRIWRLWYVNLNVNTPGPEYINVNDKLLVGFMVFLPAFTWPVTVPAYVVHRAIVMRGKRRAAYRYADRKMHELGGVNVDEPR